MKLWKGHPEFSQMLASNSSSVPMRQMTFADAESAGKRKQARKELFLIGIGSGSIIAA